MIELVKRYKIALLIIGLITLNLFGLKGQMFQNKTEMINLEKETSVLETTSCNNEEIKETPILETSKPLQAINRQEPLTVPTTPVPVYVCGQVQTPGVYYVESSAIVQDAIQLSGGLTADADSTPINLARPIKAHERIYIPKQGEMTENQKDLPEAELELTGTDDEKIASVQYTQETEGQPAKSEMGLININTASVSELMTLSGIGEVKAQAIVEYRKNVGQFKEIQDITAVSGIGDKTFEKIRSRITV